MWQHWVQAAGPHGVEQSWHRVQAFCCRLQAASAGAAAFPSGSACSLLLRLLLPALAASRAALLRPVRKVRIDALFWWRAASKLLADPPVAICQLRDRVLVAVRMEASFLEGSDQSLTVIQAQGVAGAAPKEDVPHGLLGELQSLLPISVADIFLPDPQGRASASAASRQLATTSSSLRFSRRKHSV